MQKILVRDPNLCNVLFYHTRTRVKFVYVRVFASVFPCPVFPVNLFSEYRSGNNIPVVTTPRTGCRLMPALLPTFPCPSSVLRFFLPPFLSGFSRFHPHPLRPLNILCKRESAERELGAFPPGFPPSRPIRPRPLPSCPHKLCVFFCPRLQISCAQRRDELTLARVFPPSRTSSSGRGLAFIARGCESRGGAREGGAFVDGP